MQTSNPLSDDSVLQFLCLAQRATGHVPSIREVAKQFRHKSTTSVQRCFARLLEQGDLEQDGRQYRLASFRMLPRGLPVIGRIAAGPLTEALEFEAEEFIDLGAAYDTRQHFGLRVQGDSMVDANIVSGDIAILRWQTTCNNGDIVAAVIDDEATLKRFFRRKDHIVLKPENARLLPIRVKHVEIRGVLAGVFRRYDS